MCRKRTLKVFEDGVSMCFEPGHFDDYMLTFYNSRGDRIETPTDTFLFESLLHFFDPGEAWPLVQKIADRIKKRQTIEPIVHHLLELNKYKLMHMIGALFLAEELRENTKLGLRIKLLGIYQVLILGMSPLEVASWSVGKRWYDIDAECKKYEF